VRSSEVSIVERALASKREWWQAGVHPRGIEPPLEETASTEQRLRYALQLCVASLRGDGEETPWQDALDILAEAKDLIDLSSDEPGVLLVETLVAVASPKQLLPFFRGFHPNTRDLMLEQWATLSEEIPLSETPPSADFAAAARAYASFRAAELADFLESRFIEGGDDPCSRGDLYLTRNDRFYFNYSYLCGEFGLGRDEAIESLRALAKVVKPSDDQLERLGGSDSFTELLDEVLTLDGDTVPRALAELLPLVDLPFTEITNHLPQDFVSQLAVTAVSRRLGFELETTELLEVYEINSLNSALDGKRDLLLDCIVNLFVHEPDEDEIVRGMTPPDSWQEHWLKLRKALGVKLTETVVLGLMETYHKFWNMLGTEPFYRRTAAWQVATLDNERAADWVVQMTTEHGEASPVIAGSLLHTTMPPKALERLASAWAERVEEVPQSASWSREFTVLLLRSVISGQRSWILDRLVDLYLRGGGYEAGETREIIGAVIERLLDEMVLTDEEREELDNSGLAFSLLPSDINIFTGEQVDASRWASPTSAYKYIRTLLRLEERTLDYLASLVSERRVIALEKRLRRLDFHTSVQQIVHTVQAYEGDPESALRLLILLRTSRGKHPSQEWLDDVKKLFDKLDGSALDLIWQVYENDNGDWHSLNPGMFWALRLIEEPQSPRKIAKAATEMVRRKPSFAVAALDTLDSIGTRSALSAILQMRRRIRNRKVVKLINETIDRIADEEGLDRDVFLDYAVDTGDLEDDASRLFDFGSHEVTLRLELDGRISTTVIDAKGRKLRSFPKTAKDADPALYKEFQATKKLLVETLSYQIRRLEQAMVDGRSWRGKDFLEIFREHPVMALVAMRLLWATVDTALGHRRQQGSLQDDLPAGRGQAHQRPEALDQGQGEARRRHPSPAVPPGRGQGDLDLHPRGSRDSPALRPGQARGLPPAPQRDGDEAHTASRRPDHRQQHSVSRRQGAQLVHGWRRALEGRQRHTLLSGVPGCRSDLPPRHRQAWLRQEADDREHPLHGGCRRRAHGNPGRTPHRVLRGLP